MDLLLTIIAVTAKGAKMKLNREQITKTMQDCIDSPKCIDCPNLILCSEDGFEYLLVQALALIKELTEENERLRVKGAEWRGCADTLFEEVKKVKTDTVRKMQEWLKEKIHKSVYQYWNEGGGGYYLAEDVDDDIDKIAKDMLEGNDEK